MENESFSVDAVIIYAQKGHGIRSGIFSDYTFAIFNDEKETEELVPFAKAYSGLSNSDMKLIDIKSKDYRRKLWSCKKGSTRNHSGVTF